ncbi:MAG: GntR family transcriptional regulator [Burkholderiaceae bacterium]|nr:GntR family transcriptional regulator [Burkholderiaceae bacterium]
MTSTELDISSSVADLAPLYRQVSRTLEERIRSGALPPGSPLPSEGQLCDSFGVSRITVRRALEELVQRRLVVRRRGIGSFVSTPDQYVKAVSLTGFIEDVVPLNQLKILDVTTAPLPPEVVSMAGALEVESVQRVTAVNHLSDGPLSFAKFFFPPEVAPLISRSELEGPVSPIKLVEAKTRQRVHHAMQIVEAAKADARVAKQLGIDPGTPILRIVRAYVANNGALMEAVDALYHPTRYRFAATLVPRAG